MLRPNQYVRVRLHGAVRPNAILVPQRAVQQGSKGHFVWIVDKEGKADVRPVRLGDAYNDDWFIFDGLRAGDQVVVDGAITLRPGETVKATPLAAQGAAGPADGGQQTEAEMNHTPAADAAKADK